jgi:hypothetical protein
MKSIHFSKLLSTLLISIGISILCLFTYGKAQTPELTVEMSNLDIPEIGASISIPSAWSIWTITEARAAVEKIKYPTEEVKEIAMQAASKTGSNNLRVSKHIEPYNGINPTLTIAWTPIDPSLNIGKVPKEARSEVCARTLKNTILPELTKFSNEIEVVEEATPIDDKGTGAWLTIKESVTHKSEPNNPLEVLTRIYLLMSENNFVLVTATFSNENNKDANQNKEILGAIMRSFTLNSQNSNYDSLTSQN